MVGDEDQNSLFEDVFKKRFESERGFLATRTGPTREDPCGFACHLSYTAMIRLTSSIFPKGPAAALKSKTSGSPKPGPNPLDASLTCSGLPISACTSSAVPPRMRKSFAGVCRKSGVRGIDDDGVLFREATRQ